MDVENRVSALIVPPLDAMGYDLVRVAFQGRLRHTLQIMAERRDGQAMTVDDCAEISRAVSALLDVEDPISGAYDLEVSSPGIDRPLTRPQDYERFAGLEAKIETVHPLEGQKRFRGRIFSQDEGQTVRLVLESGEDIRIPFAEIRQAKLILNDELIALATNSQIN
ncbi:MAG: ribosome maturation factor RimP [Rhodospirillaceae bacterium]|nr:ribosome maturation factor RimP [Rhodospirillaceae bacterium]